MKNLSYILRSISCLFFLLFITISCEDRLDDIFVNPNAVTTVDDAALFTKAVRDLFLSTTDQASARFAGPYAHYYVTGSTWRPPDQYGDGFDSDYNSMLAGGYGGAIRHIEEVLKITSTSGTENNVRHAIAEIVSVLAFAKVTDAFGDIPYIEGGKGQTEDIIQPRYDTQESIYNDLIDRLSASINVLKTADPALGYVGTDPIYNNDLDKWLRLANSVRLRLAMRVRFADEALSRSTLNQVLSEPLMETIDHDAYLIQTEGTGNPWFIRKTGFPSVKMSTFLIDQLQNTNDPRLAVFVSPDANGQYSGITNGLTDEAFGGVDFANLSNMGDAISSPDSKLYVMTAAETWLLRAEAALVYEDDQTMANTFFRQGIQTSLNQWEVEESEITTYMDSPVATLAGLNDEEQIGTQMWIALTPNFFESWSNIRRTGYPVIPLRESPNLSQGATNGIMPARFNYPSFEQSSNGVNLDEAIARQGPNRISTPVWWDKN